MNYNLNFDSTNDRPMSTNEMFRKLWQLVGNEKSSLIIALVVIIVNSLLNLIAPFLIGDAVDKFVQTREYPGVIRYGIILLVIFILVVVSGYFQTQLMGQVGQRMLFNLRNALFTKLQELPFTFFNQNKSGDLISRINSDTEKINQFFSHSLIQFTGSMVSMVGAAAFLLSINFKLGVAALVPGVVLWLFTRWVSPYVKKQNAVSLKSGGRLSAEIQESLSNFKIVVAFNRRDYFRQKFEEANVDNYRKSLKAGFINTSLAPVYGLLANIGQLIVLAFGIYLILKGSFTVGLLISFLSYIVLFYNPLRQIASLWSSFQVALASWDRISMILVLKNDLEIIEDQTVEKLVQQQNATVTGFSKSTISGMNDNLTAKFRDSIERPVLVFEEVSFAYTPGKNILTSVSFQLGKGKTYAFVGPTGGGKTTTASLISRLFDPVDGRILLHGKDLRSYSHEERAQRIGFILQEPVLFSGTLRENIVYGNPELESLSDDSLLELLHKEGLGGLMNRFNNDLELEINALGDGVSLGQRQLIAFMRAVLRRPDVLILDEATANIDTVTEQLLGEVLAKLPTTTTRIVIAHRLNTIENADEIFFVNSGMVTRAGSMQQAVELLLHGQRVS
ncbi:MAG: ABC transporter ATP-binding protein [Paludibacter sp.]|jgi:ATP-binding cassette subfamily B protein|nr:ABC transporter ATP-binding protein [Paludibacter sp.]